MINDVGRNLDAMNALQYVLAFAFLASYALALGEFIGTRGRRLAVLAAASSAAAFAASCAHWEQGLMLVAVALAGMGVFVVCTWGLWTLATWQEARLATARQPGRIPLSAHRQDPRNAHDNQAHAGVRST